MIPWRPTPKPRELAIFMALVHEAERCATEGERWPGVDRYHEHMATPTSSSSQRIASSK